METRHVVQSAEFPVLFLIWLIEILLEYFKVGLHLAFVSDLQSMYQDLHFSAEEFLSSS